MKTYKFHVKVIQHDITICELQFERQVTHKMWATGAAREYVRSFNFPRDSWFSIPWMEEVADDQETIDNPSHHLLSGRSKDSFCARNTINSEGFINWENPKLSVQDIIELKMESIEEARHG